MKICVVGLGYVGLSNAYLLAVNNKVIGIDVSSEKIGQIDGGQIVLKDPLASKLVKENSLDFECSTKLTDGVSNANIIIVATPTDYDPVSNKFDTSSVSNVIQTCMVYNKKAIFLIKSTVPVGFTDKLRLDLEYPHIYFSPEFLREGHEIFDNLYPSRIIVGGTDDAAKLLGQLYHDIALTDPTPILFTSSSEAEAIKLFANTYLAMRVSFFNELDSYALERDMDSLSIIEGVCLDARIGEGYNNPSFGYGGYCLPKDTKQLLANFDKVPQNLIAAIVESNRTRKEFLADKLIEMNPKLVGVYLLSAKTDSDNSRSSAVQGIMKRLKGKGIEVAVYDPSLTEASFYNSEVIKDLNNFKTRCDVIIANRMDIHLQDVVDKVFTRDIFNRD